MCARVACLPARVPRAVHFVEWTIGASFQAIGIEPVGPRLKDLAPCYTQQEMDAAIKIVRMAAPYAPFPAALKATTDKLEIIRTWQFQQNQLSSNQGAQTAQRAM